MKEKESWRDKVRNLLGIQDQPDNADNVKTRDSRAETEGEPSGPEEGADAPEEPEVPEVKQTGEGPLLRFDFDGERDRLAEKVEGLASPGSGLSPESLAAAVDAIALIAKAFVNGEAGEEMVLLLMQAIEAPDRVAAARKEGEIKGRNLAIEELMKPADDDGVPMVGGAPDNPQREATIFDLARNAV